MQKPTNYRFSMDSIRRDVFDHLVCVTRAFGSTQSLQEIYQTVWNIKQFSGQLKQYLEPVTEITSNEMRAHVV